MNSEPGTLNSERRSWLAGALIVFAALAAYHNSFSGPFIFDDLPSIVSNPTLRHLGSVWSPPHDGSGVAGRPLINFSLAVNYALGDLDVRGYHALNLAIHIFAALALFGIVRRTLLTLQNSGCGQGVPTLQRSQMRGEDSPPTTEHFRTAATPLAFTIALLWVVHPLLTESVTCIIQRTESLMGLFYLLTLYCFLRSVENSRQEQGVRSKEKPSDGGSLQGKGGSNSALQSFSSSVLWWRLASVTACLAGMATKEVMVSAPLIVFLYDRTFVAGTFRGAWQQRRKFYLGLASTWLLLGYLVTAAGGSRGDVAGFGLGITPWTYALTQCQAIIHYLKLSVWPHPLVIDYGTKVVHHLADVLPQAILLVLLVAATIFCLWRRPAIGFLGVWFFAILAPSSSFVPLVSQTVAEHRMYLPLAAVVVWIVLSLHRLIGRRSLVIFLTLAVGLGCVTVQRNKAYRSELSIWSDAATHCPDNPRTFYSVGRALGEIPDRIPEEIAAYNEALRINPDYSEAHNNLGNVFLNLPGRLPDAIAQFRAALRINPENAEAHNNLGNALVGMPRQLPKAMIQYEMALRINPYSAESHNNLGHVFLDSPGRLPDAIAEFQAALQINPYLMEARDGLGTALLRMPSRLIDAIAEYQTTLRINPDDANAHNGLGKALAQQGHLAESLAQFEEAVRMAPEYTEAHFNLGNDLVQSGRLSEAIEQYELVLQLQPDLAAARNNLEQARRDMATEQTSTPNIER